MKVIEITGNSYLIRHWFRWYRVQRGAAKWTPLGPIIKAKAKGQDFSIEKAADSLSKRAGGNQPPLPDLTE